MGIEADGSMSLAPGEALTIPEDSFVPVTDPEEIREMYESVHRDICVGQGMSFGGCAVCEVLDLVRGELMEPD